MRDGLDRLQQVSDVGGAIAGWEFVGGRPVACSTRNQVTSSYTYDAKRRLVGLDHLDGLGARVAGFAYAWDRADRRASEQHLGAAGVQARVEGYAYDSAYRVTQVAHGDGRPATSYLIDGVGNWVSKTQGGETTAFNRRQNGQYSADVLNEYWSSWRAARAPYPG